jgi:hypothetical protein
MPTAYIALRHDIHYRVTAFASMFRLHGFNVVLNGSFQAKEGDWLVIWNRYSPFHEMATAFELSGGKVLVVENGYMGKSWAGGNWFAMSLSHHNGFGKTPKGRGKERWESFGMPCRPAQAGREGAVLILPQRGIGEPGVAMPKSWPARAEQRAKDRGIAYRVRPHPGKVDALPIEKDLEGIAETWTWGSGAALRALWAGVPCVSDFKSWIGNGPDREKVFHDLAWAMWQINEIETGEPLWHFLDL